MGAFTVSLRFEAAYLRLLRSLIAPQIERIAESRNGSELQARLQDFGAARDFHRQADQAAFEMVSRVAGNNARSWRQAARQSSRGREIYRGLQQELLHIRPAVEVLVMDSSRLIRSIPINLSQRIAEFASEAAVRGTRPAAIRQEIREKLPQFAESRIRMIARTEISRTHTAITEVRAANLGITHYLWETAHDARVRKSHRLMNGVLVPFAEAPNPERLAGEKPASHAYQAGAWFNCRCIPLPLIEVSDAAWPCRVYSGGRIVRMSESQFTRTLARAA